MVDIFNPSILDKNEILGNDLMFEVWRILEKNSKNQYGDLFDSKGLNIKRIKAKLQESGVRAEEKDIFMALQALLSSRQKIVRDDYFSADSEYKLINDYYWRSKAQQYHYSFKDDVLSPKIILLESDEHAGSDMFNPKLSNNLCDYAIKEGATVTLNFGDLYEGLPELNIDEYRDCVKRDSIYSNLEEFLRQVKIFINEYPNPTPEEMRTFCLLGNHDKTMQLFMKLASFYGLFRFIDLDLRMLSMYNQSFNMFLRSSWNATLNNIDFHFSHRLYKSGIITDMRINELEDIDREKMRLGELGLPGIMLDSDYDVFLSGHLHQGFIYPDKDLFNRWDVLYLGVPSTSNVCIGKAVAYLLYMYPESNSMEISVLGCDNNMRIFEIERIEWNFRSENKVRHRML